MLHSSHAFFTFIAEILFHVEKAFISKMCLPIMCAIFRNTEMPGSVIAKLLQTLCYKLESRGFESR
jgi:hypothetical protein